jgi:hypothetical protein
VRTSSLPRKFLLILFSVLTKPQRDIFEKVKAFVMDNRTPTSASHPRAAPLAMRNDFPARERKFIEKLAEDLHLSVRWDEFDEEDINLVTWRFPGALEVPLQGEEKANGTADGARGEESAEGEWEDVEGEDEEDDAESRAAVDRVLKKYEKAHVADDDEGGGFDARHDRAVNEKMDEWKRGYYKVRSTLLLSLILRSETLVRGSWRYHTMTPKPWEPWHSDMWKGCSGLCIIIIAVSHHGGGFTITIMRPVYRVCPFTAFPNVVFMIRGPPRFARCR